MDELNYVEIGKRIKLKRKEMNLTQEKLSEIIDVSPSYISEIERGNSICSLATISNICSVSGSCFDGSETVWIRILLYELIIISKSNGDEL